jgi:hypothetical protein
MQTQARTLIVAAGLALMALGLPVQAGQTPGVATPWNGPWGGGYLNGGAYPPWSSPYVSAGYPVSFPNGNAGGYGNVPAAQPQYLPGGGYIMPPNDGGGMMPGAYSRQ